MEGSELGGDERTGDDLLAELVRESPLPIGLVDLTNLAFVAVSPSASELLDVDAPSDVLAVTAEPNLTREALDVMRRGVIDAYEARRDLMFHEHHAHRTTLWVRSLASCGHPDRALALIVSMSDGDRSLELPRIDPTKPAVAYGSTDQAFHVDRVSREIDALLGPGPEFRTSTLAQRVHPDDYIRVAEALALTVADRAPVGVTVHMQRADGTWQSVRLVVAADKTEHPPRLGFALTHGVAHDGGENGGDAGTGTSRAEILERTLQRIANEIQALGLAPSMAELPTAEEIPELADLSARQWEIVTRLLRGERVPGIARSMFLSQSTVRNHLSAVFAKLGVHSQQELIELLRARSNGSPRPE
jgi:DNA-binding CsgD family transcriptional regulator